MHTVLVELSILSSLVSFFSNTFAFPTIPLSSRESTVTVCCGCIEESCNVSLGLTGCNLGDEILLVNEESVRPFCNVCAKLLTWTFDFVTFFCLTGNKLIKSFNET